MQFILICEEIEVKKVILIIVLIVIVGGGAFSYFLLPDILASSNLFIDTREIKLETEKAGTLILQTNFDEVSVVPNSGPGEIVIKAEIELNQEDMKAGETIEKNLMLDAVRRGSRVTVEGFYRSRLVNHFSGISEYLYLTVYVPRDMVIEGDIQGNEVYIGDLSNDLILSGGRGDVIIENMRGRVEIAQHQGDLVCNNLTGNIEINDGKGDITISRVIGGVFIRNISSRGAIHADTIQGDVFIQGKGASISVKNAEGDVVIEP